MSTFSDYYNYGDRSKPAQKATIAVSCAKGIIWHVQPTPDAPYVWEVVKFTDRGNEMLGVFSDANSALAIYRSNVEEAVL